MNVIALRSETNDVGSSTVRTFKYWWENSEKNRSKDGNNGKKIKDGGMKLITLSQGLLRRGKVVGVHTMCGDGISSKNESF